MRRVITYSALVLAICVVASMSILLFYRESLQRHVLAYIVQQIETHSGYRVELDNAQIHLPLQIAIDRARFLTEDHSVAQAEKLQIAIDAWELLHARLTVHHFSVQKLTLAINQTTHEMQLWGHLSVDEPHQEWIADLHVRPVDALSLASTEVALRLKQQPEHIALHLRLAESDEGWLAHHFSLPKGYAFQGYIQAEGTTTTWQQLLAGQYDNPENKLLGEFHISYSGTQLSNRALGDAGSLMGAFDYGVPNGLQISHLEGVVGPLLIEGKGVLSLNGQFEGTTIEMQPHSDSELTRLLGVQADSTKLTCELSGTCVEPHLNLQLTSAEVRSKQTAFNQCALQAHLAYSNTGINGKLTVHGQHQETPCELETAFGWDLMNHLRIEQFHAKARDTEIKGEWEFNLAHFLVQGHLVGEIALQQWLPDAQGKIQVDLKSAIVEGIQQLTAEVHAPAIQLPQFSAQMVTAHVTLINPLAAPSGTIHFTCEHCQKGTYAFADLNGTTRLDGYVIEPATGNIQRGKGFFQLDFRDGKQDRFAFQTKGFWEQEEKQWRWTLTDLTGGIEQLPIALREPCTLHYGQVLDLSPIKLSIASGSLIAFFQHSEEQQRLLLEVQAVPLKILAGLTPHIPHQGTADLDIDITQFNKRIEGTINGKLNDLFRLDLRDEHSPAIVASFTAHLQNEQLNAAGYLTGLGPQPLEVTAQLPLVVTLNPLHLDILHDQPIAAQLSHTGKIESLLEQLLPVSNTLISGEASLQLAIGGTLNFPIIKGHCDLLNGAFELPTLSLALRDVKLHADIYNREVQLTQFSGLGVSSGYVVGKGNILLNPAFPFELTLGLKEIDITPFRYANFTANGNLTLQGNTQGGSLSGGITSQALNITVPDTTSEITKTVDVSYINQPPHLPPPTAVASQEPLWPLALNLTLDIPNKGMIEGRDWTSEWEGHLKLTGDMAHPQLNGMCKIIRGEYHFNGQPFQITEGTITFAGDPDKKTTLYVIASRDLSEIVAEIILKGPLKDPVVSFRSNPPHSQREVVSWILFGHGVSDNTPFQGTQLDESIMHLNTTGQQPDALARFRDQLGLDRIDFVRSDATDSNEVSVKVGKYLSKGILLSVNKGVSEGENSVSIEASLMKNIKVQAEVSNDDGTQLQLKWKHDY